MQSAVRTYRLVQRDAQSSAKTNVAMGGASRRHVHTNPFVRSGVTETHCSAAFMLEAAQATTNRELARPLVITDLACCHSERNAAFCFISKVVNSTERAVDACVNPGKCWAQIKRSQISV